MAKMADIMWSLYGKLYKYLFDSITFNNSSGLDINTLSDDQRVDLDNFKDNPIEFNKMIFALNNIPDKVFDLLFCDHDNICPKFYKIIFKKDMKLDTFVTTFNNLDEYIDNERYVYIRVDIIDKSKKINHVNCIIIDRAEKYILIFEPKCKLVIDIKDIDNILKHYIDTSEYKLLTPSDIGYNSMNKLQKTDCFCQTYIIFVFYLIVENPGVNYEDFSKLFNTVITTDNIGYFVYHIYKKYIESDLEINDVPILWQYPTNDFRTLLNSIILSAKSSYDNNDNYNADDIIIEEDDEDDDLLIISAKKIIDI